MLMEKNIFKIGFEVMEQLRERIQELGAIAPKEWPPKVDSLLRGTVRWLQLEDLRDREEE